MYLFMRLSIGLAQGVPKRLKIPENGKNAGFSAVLYTPVTESHKQIHTEYALNQWNPLPHEQFGAKK